MCRAFVGSNLNQYEHVPRQCSPPEYFVRKPSSDEGNQGESCAVANPINPATGNKFQSEVDYQSAGSHPLKFERWYNSSDNTFGSLGIAWRHPFSRKLTFDYALQDPWQPQTPPYSSKYNAQEAACEQGWPEIRDGVAGLASTTAVYENDTCKLYEGSTLRGTIPVYSTAYVRPANPPLVAVHAKRADGRSYRFAVSGSTFTPFADVTARLETVAGGGYRLIENDAIELYDSAGNLLSLTSRAGVQQTLAYDAQTGLLSSVTDSFGRSIAFTYVSGSGRIETLTDAAGQVYAYGYDANSNLTSIQYPDGKTRTYHYENPSFPGALTGITDENNKRFATWTYDSMGRAYISEHAGGANHTVLSYGNTGTTVTEGAQSPRTYSFTQPFGIKRLSGVSQSCGACGAAANITYDANGFVDLKTDFNGNVTDYDFDSRGLEIQRIEAKATAQERTITTQWHASFRLPAQIDEPGRRTTYTYGANGNRLTETILDIATNESRTTTWTYTSFGLVDTVDGPRTDVSDVTDFDYDTAGTLIRITNALGQITQIPEYDAHGNPKKIIDPNGVETTLTYDVRQRLKTRTVAGVTTVYDYDGVGLLDKVTLPGGAYLDYDYDDAHRLTDIRDNLGNHIHYTLDALGNRTKEEVFDPGNVLRRSQAQEFDALGRLHKIKNAANQVTAELGYDAHGNRTSQIEAGAYTTTYTPDALNRIKQVTDAANGITKYGYSAVDQLISVEDPKGLVTSYTHNALGDLKQQVSPDTGTTTYTYDAAGNRKTQTDARGVTATYSYDALNRLTGIDYPGTAEDVTHFYDGTNYSGAIPYGIGRLTGIQDESGITTLVYHARGTLASETKAILGQSYITSYTYDAADGLATVTYPSGRVIDLARNAGGQVTTVTSTLGTTVEILADTIEYAPFGAATAWTLGNGIAVGRGLNQDYRINTISAGTVQNLSYTFDLRGNITALANNFDATRSQGFGYDALSRLSSATGLYGSLGYTYDGVGNRLTETRGTTSDTYSYPATSHRLAAISGGTSVTFGYDAAGNTTQKGADTLTYNGAGRLAQVVRSGLSAGTYTYNAQGQRVMKNAGGGATVYHHAAAGNLIAETASNGAALAEYVYLDGQPLAYFASAASGTAGGGLVGLLPPTSSPSLSPHYFHLDHLGTPQHVTDDSGAVVWSADYEPFGEASVALASTVNQNMRFPGQYEDAETGLHDNWWRTYNPGSGRYLQSDPIGLEGGLSTYGYVLQNPLRFIDPEGLIKTEPNSTYGSCEEWEKTECRMHCRNRGGMKECAVQFIRKTKKIRETNGNIIKLLEDERVLLCECWEDDEQGGSCPVP
jgi:RHS repeat-associated protein